LDYVEGDFPASNLRPAAIPSSGEFGGDDSLDPFQHFGGFFGAGGNVFNPFGNFGGIGFGPINSYKPWYKGYVTFEITS
jgi:hypothetical protein